MNAMTKKLTQLHALSLATFRESCTTGKFCAVEYRNLRDHEAALEREGVYVAYGEDGAVSYAHDGDVSA